MDAIHCVWVVRVERSPRLGTPLRLLSRRTPRAGSSSSASEARTDWEERPRRR